MRHILLIASILLVSKSALAQDWARDRVEKSPRHREWVAVKHDNRSVAAYVFYPESSTKTPVVLIINEIFGMTDWVQELADEVAADGYIAMAPDLLSGMGPNGGRTDNRPDLVAAFVFYSTPPDKEAINRIKAPVYAFYAGNDARVGMPPFQTPPRT